MHKLSSGDIVRRKSPPKHGVIHFRGNHTLSIKRVWSNHGLGKGFSKFRQLKRVLEPKLQCDAYVRWFRWVRRCFLWWRSWRARSKRWKRWRFFWCSFRDVRSSWGRQTGLASCSSHHLLNDVLPDKVFSTPCSYYGIVPWKRQFLSMFCKYINRSTTFSGLYCKGKV